MMDISKIKLPVAVIGIVLAQAFGIIWYVATLDSTVSHLQRTVEEIRLNTAATSVAVIQNDIANIKINLEKLEQASGLAAEPFDDNELKETTKSLGVKLQNILDGKGATWNKSALQLRIEALEKEVSDNHTTKKKKSKE